MHTASTITTTTRASTNVIPNTTPIIIASRGLFAVGDGDTLAPEFDKEKELVLVVLDINDELCVEVIK